MNLNRMCRWPRSGVRRRLTAVVVGLAVVLVAASQGAQAATSPVQAIFNQCASGHLSGNYTVEQLQQALSVMPAAVSQYTSCPDVVQSAIIRTRHDGGPDAAIRSSGAFLPLPVIAILAALIATAGVLGVMALRRR